jgi:hypothetical protein
MKNLQRHEGRPLPRSYLTPQVNQASDLRRENRPSLSSPSLPLNPSRNQRGRRPANSDDRHRLVASHALVSKS